MQIYLSGLALLPYYYKSIIKLLAMDKYINMPTQQSSHQNRQANYHDTSFDKLTHSEESNTIQFRQYGLPEKDKLKCTENLEQNIFNQRRALRIAEDLINLYKSQNQTLKAKNQLYQQKIKELQIQSKTLNKVILKLKLSQQSMNSSQSQKEFRHNMHKNVKINPMKPVSADSFALIVEYQKKLVLQKQNINGLQKKIKEQEQMLNQIYSLSKPHQKFKTQESEKIGLFNVEIQKQRTKSMNHSIKSLNHSFSGKQHTKTREKQQRQIQICRKNDMKEQQLQQQYSRYAWMTKNQKLSAQLLYSSQPQSYTRSTLDKQTKNKTKDEIILRPGDISFQRTPCKTIKKPYNYY